MAVLLSLAEHLLNFKDVEILSCDMSEQKSCRLFLKEARETHGNARESSDTLFHVPQASAKLS